MQTEFETKLIGLGLSYGRNDDDFYSISNPNGVGNQITVQFISSLQPVKGSHGSKNGNDVQSIGLFKFKFPLTEIEPDLFIFALPNPVKNQADFLIIPTDELLTRLASKNPGRVHRSRVEMVFWVLEDGFVYDATHLSPEGEWYFLSPCVNGRMADGTDFDYSEYMNNWRRLIV